jgi:hypothetical protein
MRVDIMKPVYNLEPKYRVTMLAREERTRSPQTPPVVKGLVRFTDGSRTVEGTRVGIYGQFVNRRLGIPLGKHATVFQAVVYVILACETEAQDWPEKYVSICSDTQAAIKCFRLQRRLLWCQCKQTNDISAWHSVTLYWVPGYAGVREIEIADRLTRSGSGQWFIGPEPFLGVSRQNTRRKMKHWMKNQHLALWRSPCSTQRQAQELISGPNLATRGPIIVL